MAVAMGIEEGLGVDWGGVEPWRGLWVSVYTVWMGTG
jgi:hypothetical protein